MSESKEVDMLADALCGLNTDELSAIKEQQIQFSNVMVRLVKKLQYPDSNGAFERFAWKRIAHFKNHWNEEDKKTTETVRNHIGNYCSNTLSGAKQWLNYESLATICMNWAETFQKESKRHVLSDLITCLERIFDGNCKDIDWEDKELILICIDLRLHQVLKYWTQGHGQQTRDMIGLQDYFSYCQLHQLQDILGNLLCERYVYIRPGST